MGIIGNGIALLGGGVKIKSIQRGITSVPITGHYKIGTDVISTISPVNPIKTLVIFNGHKKIGSNGYTASVRLIDETHVGCAARHNPLSGSGNWDVDVHWTVVEFEDGVTVQRGVIAGDPSIGEPYAQSVSISPVDLSKSFAVYTGKAGTDTFGIYNAFELANADILTVYQRRFADSGSADHDTWMPWQVVEFE